ncbi:Lacal_2735 family protein [Yeosuana sp. AK3]
MNKINVIKSNQAKLREQYKELIELAYNIRQTDSAMSDISEFKAIKLLDKLNKLKFLFKEQLNTFL